jgi:hypothetical protein
MSIASWKKQFMPPLKGMLTKTMALELSLLKWRGLQESNLARHRVWINDCELIENGANEGVDILGADQCLLCDLYFEVNCRGCPLNEARGERCYREAFDDSNPSPYLAMTREGNPKPMIKLIQKCIKHETSNNDAG